MRDAASPHFSRLFGRTGNTESGPEQSFPNDRFILSSGNYYGHLGANMGFEEKKPVICAILIAMLFGGTAPVAKLLLENVAPLTLAALL
jgi:hypothetical protein